MGQNDPCGIHRLPNILQVDPPRNLLDEHGGSILSESHFGGLLEEDRSVGDAHHHFGGTVNWPTHARNDRALTIPPPLCPMTGELGGGGRG